MILLAIFLLLWLVVFDKLPEHKHDGNIVVSFTWYWLTATLWHQVKPPELPYFPQMVVLTAPQILALRTVTKLHQLADSY